jgi:hypothetical protein
MLRYRAIRVAISAGVFLAGLATYFGAMVALGWM